MPCIAISLHTLCSNSGIINFPTVKLTIPGGHGFAWHRKSGPMWSKIASWTTLVGTSATFCAPSSFSLMHKNNPFQPHSGQRAVLVCSKALHCDFIAHMVLKSWNHQSPSGKLTILGGHNPALAPKIWANVVQNCILDDTCAYIGDLLGPLLIQFNIQEQAIPATQRPTSRSCVLQSLALRFHCTHGAQIMESLCDGWRVGLVHAKCHCNHIRDNRYRGGQR